MDFDIISFLHHNVRCNRGGLDMVSGVYGIAMKDTLDHEGVPISKLFVLYLESQGCAPMKIETEEGWEYWLDDSFYGDSDLIAQKIGDELFISSRTKLHDILLNNTLLDAQKDV